jgi:hypothetical protein
MQKLSELLNFEGKNIEEVYNINTKRTNDLSEELYKYLIDYANSSSLDAPVISVFKGIDKIKINSQQEFLYLYTVGLQTLNNFSDASRTI